MLITINNFKCAHINFYPAYLKDLLTLRTTVNFLRGTDIKYFRCVDLLPLLMVFTLLSILPANLGTLYLRTLERSPGSGWFLKRLIRTISFQPCFFLHQWRPLGLSIFEIFVVFYWIAWSKQQQRCKGPKWPNNSRGFNECTGCHFRYFFPPKNHWSYSLEKKNCYVAISADFTLSWVSQNNYHNVTHSNNKCSLCSCFSKGRFYE